MADEGAQAAGGRIPIGWRIVSVFGEILITVGVLFLLLVAYELWWTNIEADQAISQQRDQIRDEWREPQAAPTMAPIPAEAFGLMFIPRLSSDVWGIPLIEGVSDSDIAKGIGHFPNSVLPGEVGNTAFAGHRATHGEPLKNIDKLQVGDLVHIETATDWYTYRLDKDQIVKPTDVWVVDPVPGQPLDAVPTEKLLTLVTCNPRWGSTQRWVWWGYLVDVRSKALGPPPDVLALERGA